MVCNYRRSVLTYIWHLDSCDMSDNNDNSDNIDSSDSRLKQMCMQDFVTVFTIIHHYLWFGGTWISAMLALV